MIPSSIHQLPVRLRRTRRATGARVAALVLSLLSLPAAARAAQGDVVLYASDVSNAQGNFRQAGSASGANQVKMESTDWGWMAASALASPNDYFEATFTAQANTPYHVWLRMRAAGDSKYNESVWVQFDAAVNSGGSPIYRIGSGSGLLVNLENCTGCGVSGWGWQDDAHWAGQSAIVRFPTTGSHTIRVQIREDGVQVDQIVLSPNAYLASPPGALLNDATIVAKGGSSQTVTTTPTSTPLSGSPAIVPGTLQAEGFDAGGEGVAYHDVDSANLGGIYRPEGVDIAWATGGTGLVGWVLAGEWLNYSVDVQSAGAYSAEFLVASYGQGGTFHIEMNGGDVSGPITIPDTGGWQSWRTISARVSLNAGRQFLRLVMDRNGTYAVGNFDYFRLTPATTVQPPTGGGGQVRVMTWNIQSGRDLYRNDNLWGQVQFIASQNVNVVILQEVSLYDGDQPTIYKNALQSVTGQTWHSSWAPSCASGGCLGNLILTRLALQSASMIFMPPSAGAQATVSVGGVPVTFFAAHLDAYDLSVRTRELYQLLDWAGSFGGAKIIGGDFNSWWGEWWIQYTTGFFGDTWREVSGNQDGGYTIGNVRFDYLFRSGLTPVSCWVPYTELSDHRPVIADYRVQ